MRDHFKYFKYPHFTRSTILAFLLLIASLFINFYAGIYATERASNPVTDIILSNTRAYDLDGAFIYGSWILVAFIAYLAFRKPQQMPFLLKSIALFVLIRAIFISMTHIGPFPSQAIIDPRSFLSYFIFGGDLFFSGHAGLPFLLGLIYWDDKLIRYTFFIASFAFSVIVLLAHLHYTIDVLSAFFIAYGIFHIAELIFFKDREFFFLK